MIVYLDLERVLRQVERLGFVVRDLGLVESAVARPRASAFAEDAYPDLWSKAAALVQSIVHNQALVDGNKRLAWLMLALFLGDNGYDLAVSADIGEHFMIRMVAAGDDLDRIAAWIENHVTELPGAHVVDLSS